MRTGFLVVTIAGSLWAAPARADVLPEPSVPEGWDEHPPPRPVPPPDKELPAALLGLVMVGLMGCVGSMMLRRGSRVAAG